jgi:hypothetical protein
MNDSCKPDPRGDRDTECRGVGPADGYNQLLGGAVIVQL